MGNLIGRGNVRPKERPIRPNHTVPSNVKATHKDHPNHGYKDNQVKTTKYTVLSFLPKNLFEQFHRFANLYFIFVVALNWVPEINAFAKEVAAVPVIFVLSVTAVKDAYEDFRRYRSDKKVNALTCRVYSRSEERYVKVEWKNVYPGDFVHLSCNEIIPADILLLRSSDPGGICHVETSNLDGENNLKQRQAVTGVMTNMENFDPRWFTYTVTVDEPNTSIYNFKGYVEKDGEKIPLNSSNLLLRGCMIKNTDFIEGLVLYAGHETKAMLNNRGPRYKRTKQERKINRDVIWCVILLLFLCFFCAIGSGIWLADYNDLTKNTNLVPFIPFGDLDQYSPLYQGFIVFWTYIIIFQTVIPLPLYVSVELVKLGQVYFITQDLELYDEESDKRMECRALNITEDLGQIEYIFSDKTGTLTENKMEFKGCTIGGVDYPHFPDEEFSSESNFDSRISVTNFSRNSSVMDNLPLEPALQRELSNMCLRSLESVELTIPPHVKRVQEFFLLMAICNTVVVSHHPHEDMLDESGFLAEPAFNKLGDRPSEATDKYNRIQQTSTPVFVRASKSRSFGSLSASDLGDYPGTPSEGSVTGSSFLSDSSSQTRYEAESPDELALVRAASTYGCRLLKRSPDKVVVWLPAEGDVEFFVLNVLDFDSTRKRMSIIVQHPLSKEIILFVKGADSAILSVLHKRYKEDHEEKRVLEETNKHLLSYALRGLRTLCMARKVLTGEEYSAWLVKHKEAEAAMDDREIKLRDSACRIEADLDLLGATGIEDRLQDGVPQTIAKLRAAGINIWVLTGDKQETAMQIAYACKLFSKDQEVFTINATSKELTRDLLEHHLCQIDRDQSVRRTPEQANADAAPHDVEHQRSSFISKERSYALVIDGHTLSFALLPELEELFLKLSQKCHSVVCCRATPIQKGNVVKLVRDNLNKMTLAIGDGANDVSMIQTADVGVGISGQEGMQAVMASDFAIARFRFLERLLLVHGHWCYDRLARFAAVMFYKSMLSVFVLFWFQIFSGFSGSLMIDSLYLTLQHVVFTALPPLINGIFDKDLSAETLLAYPQVYRPCQAGEMYTHWTFLVILMDSLWQSLMIYFIPHLAYSNNSVGIWEFGTTIDVCQILSILLMFGIENNSWVWLQWFSLVISFIIFWMFCVISNAFFFTFDHPSNPYWVMEMTISNPIHSCMVVLACVAALLPRLTFRMLQNSFFPTSIQWTLIMSHADFAMM
ncbi:probable phospholipid-transporting ATPase VA isoform X2 [Pomacea canaliculata]|uniref:probable phospholipid-transporting ATPase VA isoform X2 n=1 Tax=Pomacea canaliculata TaxID=400727 RepID=UPI000D7281ED|nr:probable phospholipid-transporting ATPase VA isoform X2 [Pomacea canaliculata]